MAIAYKSKVFSNSAANTSQALFTAVASNTLVKSIICNNDGKSTGTATLRINESGGNSELIRRVTIASGDTSVELLYDVLALEVGDILYVTSTDTDITFIMTYAEDSESLVLQSIDVLSDVNTTGKVDGNVLTWDSTAGQWEAAAPTGGGATTLDGLTDVAITSPIDHDSLVYDETALTWINGAPKSLDMPVYAASAIAKGKLVKAVGSHGDKVSVGLFDLDVDDPKYLIGLTVDAISTGGTGHVRTYGELRGISTNAYAVGTVLYASGTAGDLSTTAGVPEIPVAIVTKSQQNTGRLFIRTWSPAVAKVHSVNGETGVVVLKGDQILRSASDNSTIDGDLTTAEGNINAIKAVLKYPSATTTGIQTDTSNKLEIDSATQKAVFTINGTSAATIGPSQSLFPQVRIGTTGDTYDLPITRGAADGEVPIYTTSSNTSEWRKLGTSSLSGDSDGISEGTTNLFLTSTERTKLLGIATGAEVNQNAFSNIAVANQSAVVAGSTTDTLTLAAANTNVVITTNATTDTVTFGLGTDIVTGSVSVTGALTAIGNVVCDDIIAGGDVSVTGVISANSATLVTLNFTGGGTTSIGPNNALPTDPADLEIRTNGNCDVVLDYDDNESSQAFRVKDGDGNIMFSVDEDGISVANGTASTGAVLRLGEATANGSNYVALQAPVSLAGNTTWTLPLADGLANQAIITDGSGNLDWLDVPSFPQFMTGSTTASTSYTLSLSDAGRMIIATASSAVTVTVPTAASVGFEQDVEISFMQKGTGQITIAGASGVNIRTTQTLKTAKQYAIIAIKKIDTDEWVCVGDRQAL